MVEEKQLPDTPVFSETEQKLLASVDEHKDELIDLLQKMIAIDSRVYDTNVFVDQTPIIQFVSTYLQKNGFNTKLFSCPHQNQHSNTTQTWPNLIASYNANQSGKSIQFLGHLDVVPFSTELWDKDLDPMQGMIKKNKLYGRGSNDMKGGCAGLIMAAKILKEMNLLQTGKVQLWFTPDEELDGPYGARFMVKNHLDIVNTNATIIAEPTGQSPIKSPVIILGEKGMNWFRLHFHGASGHGSMPKKKGNAINKVSRFMNNMAKCKIPNVKPPFSKIDLIKALLSRFRILDIPSLLQSDDGEQKNPYDEDAVNLGAFFNTTYSFNQIHGGKKVNIVPDSCDLEIDIRLLPGIKIQQIFDALVNYATKLGYRIEIPPEYSNLQQHNKKMQKRPVDIELKIITEAPGNLTDPAQPFVQLMSKTFEDIYRVKRVFFCAPGSSDATHLRRNGIQNVVLFGPSGGNAHGSNEYVEIDHVINCCKVYLLTAYRFLMEK